MSLLATLAPLWPPFLVGLLGGVHCASMCGGIATAVGMRARRQSVPERPLVTKASPAWRAVEWSPAVADPGPGVAFPAPGLSASCPTRTVASTPGPGHVVSRLLAYNGGRIAMYGLLGGLVGSAGSAAWLMDGVLPVQQAAFLLASVMLLVMGAILLGERRVGRWLESLGRPVWRRLQPLAARSLTGTPGTARLALTGGLWGLVPCGMVYGVLLTALASGSAAQGAVLMLAFGVGTLPNLMAMGWSAGWLARLRGLPAVRVLAAAMLIGFGVLGVARVLGAPMGPLGDLLCFVPAGR